MKVKASALITSILVLSTALLFMKSYERAVLQAERSNQLLIEYFK
ncbi:MAG: hypothetical protein Q3960_00880 [Lactobacillus sp.]|nr:hypothetical protein [Lactobacillus sp.]